MTAAAKTSSKAMPASRSGLLVRPMLRSELRWVRAANAVPTWSGHQARLGRFATQRQRGKGLRAEVDREDGQHGQRQRDQATGEGEGEERHDLGDGVGEDVEHELAHVVIDPAALLDTGDHGGEVVVGEHDGGGLAGHLGAAAAHGHPDVGVVECGGVVDPVAGHGHDVAALVQGVGDPQLGLGCGPGEDELLVAREQHGQLGVGKRIERSTVHDTVHSDAHAAGDLGGGAAVVAGHDVDADPGAVTRRDRGGDLGAGWVEQPHQPE